MLGWKRVILTLAVAGLGLANVSLAVAPHGGAGMAGARHAGPDAASQWPGAEWWEDFHWHKTTIYSSVSSDNVEAIRAANVWNSQSILTLPSTSSHTDISILRGAYGLTRWRGLAEIKPPGSQAALPPPDRPTSKQRLWSSATSPQVGWSTRGPGTRSNRKHPMSSER